MDCSGGLDAVCDDNDLRPAARCRPPNRRCPRPHRPAHHPALPVVDHRADGGCGCGCGCGVDSGSRGRVPLSRWTVTVDGHGRVLARTKRKTPSAPECRRGHHSQQVGVRGLEPPAFCSRSRRATRLRYTPMFCPSGTAVATRAAAALLGSSAPKPRGCMEDARSCQPSILVGTAAACRAAMAAARSGALNTPEPLTSTSVPASTKRQALWVFTPPSTSMTVSRPRASI